jgi:hypothetical protein
MVQTPPPPKFFDKGATATSLVNPWYTRAVANGSNTTHYWDILTTNTQWHTLSYTNNITKFMRHFVAKLCCCQIIICPILAWCWHVYMTFHNAHSYTQYIWDNVPVLHQLPVTTVATAKWHQRITIYQKDLTEITCTAEIKHNNVQATPPRHLQLSMMQQVVSIYWRQLSSIARIQRWEQLH